MPEALHHISSAVVLARPDRVEPVIKAITDFAETEVHAHEGGRIVLVMEGRSTRDLGDRLASIALIPGVITANMVFEHVEQLEENQL
ncbi:chaperone NapD [Kordiimonas sp.]|uniref:chaperone NapD n=1 Tax=Kordiimonas sp. TaxID=1970157 RepID=UPI003A950A92